MAFSYFFLGPFQVEKDAKIARTDGEIDVAELYNDVYEENLQVRLLLSFFAIDPGTTL